MYGSPQSGLPIHKCEGWDHKGRDAVGVSTVSRPLGGQNLGFPYLEYIKPQLPPMIDNTLYRSSIMCALKEYV